MKITGFAVITALCILFFLPVFHLNAGGVQEEGRYRSELQLVFADILEDIYNENVSAEAAKSTLDQLRQKYRISYTDEAGIMDDIIDQAAAGTLSKEEAGLYFQLLQDGKLMEHRRRQNLSVRSDEKVPSGDEVVSSPQQEVQKPHPGESQPPSAGNSAPAPSSTGSSGSSNSKR